jgi:membrane protease YdiL (CAAX protease family)
LWWSVPILARWHVFKFPGIVFLFVGGIGVSLGGITMSWFIGGKESLRALGRRLIELRRISGQWFAVIVLLWVALALVGAGIAAIVNGTLTHIEIEELQRVIADPGVFLMTLLAIFMIGPLPEEIGWRGYWLDRLQCQWNALTSSLIVGAAWASWHAPLFFMVGYFSSWNVSPTPIPFALNILIASILYTWVYNNTNRSVLAAILFHFLQNLTGQLVGLSQEAEFYQTLMMALLATVVLIWWGPQNLRRGPR